MDTPPKLPPRRAARRVEPPTRHAAVAVEPDVAVAGSLL